MIDLIKKAVLTGVGVASLTKEKVEELAQEITEKTKMSEAEGEKFLEEMLERAEESKTALKTQTDNIVKKVVSKMQFAQVEDIESLKNEIEKLRVEIENLKEKE